MWEFLSGVLEQGGVVAALFFLLAIAAGLAIRVLWRQNQALHAEIKTQADTHSEQLRAMAEKHTEEKKQQADEYGQQLMRLTGHRDELQERRIAEKAADVEKVMNYIGNVDRFVNKLETVVDILIQAGRG